MKKRLYNKPTCVVFEIKKRPLLLVGSDTGGNIPETPGYND